jgi:hypothetical protein
MYRILNAFGGMLMSVKTFQGTVEKGQVKLAAKVRLPEKAKVYVVVPDFEDNPNGEKFNLAELVSRMPPDYQAGEESLGEPVGKEEWST